jgi:hypothetical protein
MEDILFDHFKEHFNQATGTPFTHGILRKTFEYGGHNNNTNHLLDGILAFQKDDLPKEMTWLLSNFRRSRPPLSSHFPPEDIKLGF